MIDQADHITIVNLGALFLLGVEGSNDVLLMDISVYSVITHNTTHSRHA
jgi:hypothetical protein